jgi:hypothetical protein
LINSITGCLTSVSSPEVKMTVGGLFGEKSWIQIIGMLLIDLTSRAPAARSATSSLEVRRYAFNAARDRVIPAKLMSGVGSICALVPIAEKRVTWDLSIAWQRGKIYSPLRTLLDSLQLKARS